MEISIPRAIKKTTLDGAVISVGVSKLGLEHYFMRAVDVTLLWNEENKVSWKRSNLLRYDFYALVFCTAWSKNDQTLHKDYLNQKCNQFQ